MAFKQVKRRQDYTHPEFLIDDIKLSFRLDPEETIVESVMSLKRNGNHKKSLILDGEQLELIRVVVNDVTFETYDVTDTTLTLHGVPDEFTLAITCKTNPSANTSLEGLYVSDGAYCTQCEAEGFRKITYFLDRPDVLSTYSVLITASRETCPYLLSNGNEVGRGNNADGTHWVEWNDPYKKPCYLFALVAGDFDRLDDEFITQSNKTVKLELFVDKGMVDRGQHALDSLKKAMRWDEEVFDLEYDLDIYMIVAVDFFNMGAMENKGLNVFNSKFVLANNQTATDEDFFNIESVIAHEYFHNWTGNRVTCRDWFQLSLKEGLTVFRDQLFSETFNSKLATRIKQVKVMQEHQFAEDAGPMSHPIRPEEVMEMNNFYTVTVYDKGAEVIRMLWTLLGEEGFKNGLKRYFALYDGQAVTCDDFVNAMQDANQVDLSLFKRWYSQSGTPVIEAKRDPNDSSRMIITQRTPPTADQTEKQHLYIPLEIEALSDRMTERSQRHLIPLITQSKSLSLDEQTSAVVINSAFSAPVKVKYEQNTSELMTVMLKASNKLDRWSASQTLYVKAIENKAAGELNDVLADSLSSVFRQFVKGIDGDLELLGEALLPPSLESIIANQTHIDLDTLEPAYRHVCQTVASGVAPLLLELITELSTTLPYTYDQASIIRRRSLSTVLKLLAHSGQGAEHIKGVFTQSDNMTDTLSALHAAQIQDFDLFDSLMTRFEQKWHSDSLVLDKWFALHATANRDDILSRIELLMQHENFSLKNPNRIRAILGSFAFYNTSKLHSIDGSGYRFLSNHIIDIDKTNPQVAARIVTPLLSLRKFDETRQELMRINLTRILDSNALSNDMFEKVSKSLRGC